MNTPLVIAIALAVVAVAVGAALYAQRRRRSQAMRTRYGAEYIAAADELGGRRKAEAELRAREERVHQFDIRPLRLAEAERFTARWRRVQAEFVDDPGVATADADALLREVMHARGYPVADFEQRAADLSVDHPKLVANYRLAHDLALRHQRGECSTEDMRRAMIHYRDLFDELVAPAGDDRRPGEGRSFRQDEPREVERERWAETRAERGRTDPRRGERPRM